MSALAVAMLLTGAGEVQRGKPIEAQPPYPVPVVMPPAPPLLPVPPAPPPSAGIRPNLIPPQRARANLNSYFSADDYPVAAFRGYHEGTVGFSLTIGTNGRVSACQVTVSSGSAPLDTATCRILRSRTRYTPARDYAGNPIEGRDSGRVTWRLPDTPSDRAGFGIAYRPADPLEPYVGDPVAADVPPGAAPPVGEGVSELRVAIGRDGRVIGCDVQTTSGSPALDAAGCRLYTERGRFEPARDAAGTLVCDLMWIDLDWRDAFAAAPPAPPGTRPAVARPPRPLREQLNARLCPGWPVVDRRPVAPVPVPVPPAPPPYRGFHVPAPAPAVAPPGYRPLPQSGRPERVRANMNEYFSVDDYPAAALRANAQGVVTVRLTIGLDGRVSGCVVTGSSGSPALDEATCRILRSRARYYPARDPLRDPLFEPDSVRITWRLPAR